MRVLIDSHCHLDDASFDVDRAQSLQRAQQVGVFKQIIPAVDVTSWERIREISNQFNKLYPAYGLHPCYFHQPADLQKLEYWLSQYYAVAVGECGLDFFIPHINIKQQTYFFKVQASIAQAFDLPIIIHARRAVDEVIKILKQFKNLRGVVHSFVGSEQQANLLINQGFLLGFGGTITYPRANRLRKLVQILPLESILLETDAPDQPLCGKQGQRNEPAFLPLILNTIADLRQTEPETLEEIFFSNTTQLFKL
jgi:TatD DNase family protein